MTAAQRSLLEADHVAEAAGRPGAAAGAASGAGAGPGAGLGAAGAFAGAGPRPPYFRLPDLRLRGLLHLLRDDPRVQAFAERELRRLLAAR